MLKIYSFPYRCVDEWNRLDREVVEAEAVQSFKRKLDDSRQGERTVRALFISSTAQVGEHKERERHTPPQTHTNREKTEN